MSVETLEQEALALPTSGRVWLIEKLLASLSGQIDPAVDRANLDEVNRRRASANAGRASFVDGPEALRQAKAAVRK